MQKYTWDIEKIKDAVKDSINFAEVLDKLQISIKGNNRKTLKRILDEENIDYSHFTGRARDYSKPLVKDINYYLTNQGYISTSNLKQKLYKLGLKENRCECCNITEWNGNPLVMQLHHIDGNPKNNSLENLQILCPNCHAQTENYCGSANKTNKSVKHCPDCGKEISYKSNYCSVCAHNHSQNTLDKCPSLEQFTKDFLELKSFVGVGKKYNVSDNAVKKWAKKLGLPYHSKELLAYLKNLS